MEPKLPAPQFTPERSAVTYGQSGERSANFSAPETNIERGAEQLEQRSEVGAEQAAVSHALPPPLTVAPMASLSGPSSTAPIPVTDDTPLVANDDDLIEREWVDKAKKIISQTKDDPYRRELEVGKLQADYLLKRYGKELGAS
jgi:hypothetical protein